ncbi:glycosyltransferase family 2 protein [Candidatus Chloroploca sp. Khr17]|uniref:glycosyltransferase family 2 protein n=1 Tax=Candidatus Chloroploca sp. Khr17 TaxID=2496869 RepID=UPI00101E0A59|nr:glycosyltransferase family 2 protein [Candidatus Chloroploca sp. Khr17]
MTRQPRVICVVVAWGLPEQTQACLASLQVSIYAPLQIVLVDNGSPVALHDTLACPDACELIRLEHNCGYTIGTNHGLRRALALGADYVLLLNNDARVAPHAIARLVAAAQQAPHAGVLGAKILYDDTPDRIWSFGSRRRRWSPVPLDLGRGRRDSAALSAVIPVDYVNGCAMLLSRALLTHVGLLDPLFPMYYEDVDLCRRAQAAGFTVLAVGDARVWHLVSRTAQQLPRLSLRCHTAGRLRFYRRHPHGPAPVLTAGWLALRTAVDLARLAARRRAQLPAYLAGLADGLRTV